MIWLLLAVAEPSFDAEVEACRSDEHVLTFCFAQRRYDRADARLNAQWRTALSRVRTTKGKHAAERLRQHQRSWLKKSDADCQMIFPHAPTSQQGRNWLECMADMSDRRAAELRAMIGNS